MAGEKISLESGFADKYSLLKPVGKNLMDDDMGNGVCIVKPPNEQGLRRVCIGGTLHLKRISDVREEYVADGFTDAGGPDSCKNCIVFQRVHGIEPPFQSVARRNPISSTLDTYLRENL